MGQLLYKKTKSSKLFFLILNDYGLIPILILMTLIFKALSNVNKKNFNFRYVCNCFFDLLFFLSRTNHKPPSLDNFIFAIK